MVNLRLELRTSLVPLLSGLALYASMLGASWISSLLELCLALLVEGEARRPEDRQRPHIRLNTALIFPKLLHIQFRLGL